MLALIICIILGAFGGAAVGWDLEVDAFFGALWGAVVGFAIAVAIGGAAYGDSHRVVTSNVPLVSLADGSGEEDHFFLGSGTIDSEPVYTWYESAGENNYVRKTADADVSVVHYLAAGEQPHYTTAVHHLVHAGWNTWGLQTGDDSEARYDFYVPRGSIQQTYRLDNK